VPFGNKLSESKAALQALLPPPRDSLSELQAYWQFNDLLVESSYILFIVDRKDVNELDVTRPRQFFDRLRATKELAYQCQGKIEISFYGYDSDPREIFEIEAVRQYIVLLDDALPELFFFVRTEKPAPTIRTFAFCLTRVVWEGKRSTRTVTRRVVYDTNNVAKFLMRHWPSLNEMTEWLSMSIEENKRISFAVTRALGIEPPEDGDHA
jgi:hypothetical protein